MQEPHTTINYDRLADLIVAKLSSHPPASWLDTKAAASYLRLSASTLERYRSQSEGPPYSRVGDSAVRYRVTDLDAWAESKSVRP